MINPNKLNEEGVKEWIARYLNLQYPDVPFFFQWDHVKLPGKTVGRLNKLKWKERWFIWPDLFIAKPKFETVVEITIKYHGLCLEIKQSYKVLFKGDGVLREGVHIQNQKRSLELLRAMGYAAEFVWSPESAKEIIDDYLGG